MYIIMSSRSVLVVEDNLSVLKVVAKMLKLLKHDVVTAENGMLGLERISESSFDYIILDYQLPDLSCDTLVKKFHEIQPDAKIYIASGLGEAPEITQMLDIGAYGVLAKPFSLNDLKSTII